MKLNLSKEKIKEISEELNMGMDCYVHKNSHEIITLPNELSHFGYDDDDDNAFGEDRSKVEENIEDYLKFSPMDSNESFRVMENFMESLDDRNQLKNELANALSRNRPFRRFKDIIDDSGIFRQKWFDFEAQQWIEYVEDTLWQWNSLEEEDI